MNEMNEKPDINNSANGDVGSYFRHLAKIASGVTPDATSYFPFQVLDRLSPPLRRGCERYTDQGAVIINYDTQPDA